MNYDLDDEEKLLLYAIGCMQNTPIKGKIKLQKLLFLVSNVFGSLEDLLMYEPHLYGPYSEVVENVLQSLISLGLVKEVRKGYGLTEEGKKVFNSLTPKEELVKVMNDFKEFLNDLDNDELLAFIYVSYPNYIKESVKWDELKQKRKKLAISLLKKGKISFSKAAEIAGMSSNEFDRYLKEMGVAWRNGNQ